MGYQHIGAQDRSQVIWQSNDHGIIGSGDRRIGKKKGRKKKEIVIQSQERNSQGVSSLCLFSFFPCPDLPLPLLSPVGECPLVCWLVSFCVLTCPSLCCLQMVSASWLVSFFPCPDLSLPLWSPESECPLLGHSLSIS